MLAIVHCACLNNCMIEIDGVRNELHRPCTEAGDYISDNYRDLIDLSTSPDRTAVPNVVRIASLVRRLNRNLATTSAILVGTELDPIYEDVISQLNEINADLPVDALHPLVRDESRFTDYSGSYRWAS